MHLVQILLPLYDNGGRAQPRGHFEAVTADLTERFGGLTAFTRAPAEGLWMEGEGGPRRDDVVVVEVMTESLDRAWWGAYRRGLEERFRQEVVVVRAHPVAML
jgi:hypothetical protein